MKINFSEKSFLPKNQGSRWNSLMQKLVVKNLVVLSLYIQQLLSLEGQVINPRERELIGFCDKVQPLNTTTWPPRGVSL